MKFLRQHKLSENRRLFLILFCIMAVSVSTNFLEFTSSMPRFVCYGFCGVFLVYGSIVAHIIYLEDDKAPKKINK